MNGRERWYGELARHIGELGLLQVADGFAVEVVVKDARHVGDGLYRRLQLLVTPTQGRGSAWVEAKSWTRYPAISQPGVAPGRS